MLYIGVDVSQDNLGYTDTERFSFPSFLGIHANGVNLFQLVLIAN